ncbi:hypothetical protein KJS94_11745 [Flavihumibacter rivuli]|uniref:hypothetical protein n=1 Tax=Flavihumibacter rivuli TaxID=2838156 RepID=UPI001BDF27D8|nr:hypothetical protein [Flavihumibacter rivuli]ULQ55314.1 hypothetical protein KJS94_11745 [Flavihumibacter rivuli]
MTPQLCYFCGHAVTLVFVHSHYQCPVCGTNALPCCEGESCVVPADQTNGQKETRDHHDQLITGSRELSQDNGPGTVKM